MPENNDGLKISKEIYWPLFFSNYQFCSSDNFEIAKLNDFLTTKLSFGFVSPFSNEFHPLAIFGGKRSANYEDLSDDDFKIIAEIAVASSDSYVLAKCYNVLFVKTNEKVSAIKSADSFMRLANEFIANDSVFASIDFFQHALFLYKEAGDKQKIEETISRLVDIDQYKNDEDLTRVLNGIFEFLSKCNYSKYNKRNLIELSERMYIKSDFCLELFENISKYYSSIHDIDNQNVWLNKYADLCLSLCDKYSPRGFRYVKYAIEKLERLSDLNDDRINQLRFRKDEEDAKFFEFSNMQSIPLPDKLQKEIGFRISNVNAKLEKENDSISRFQYFLSIFLPIKSSEIEDFCKGLESSVFAGMFNTVIFDKNKRIVDEIRPDDKQKKEKHNISQAYALFHAIYIKIGVFYLCNSCVDNELKDFLLDIISHNELVPNERIQVVYDSIIAGFNMNIRKALFVLISQFEFGCVDYLKRNSIYPVVKKGSMTVHIDLNHILTEDKFRNKIVELVGEDLTKELEYLLVQPSYGNLRNYNYHEGFDKDNVANNHEIMAFLRIINVYCMGYDAAL